MRTLATLVLGLAMISGLSGCLDDAPETDNTTTSPTTDMPMTQPVTVNVTVTITGIYPATIAYEPDTITVPAGATVNLTLINEDSNVVVSHDWAIEGFENTTKTDAIGSGETTTLTFIAPAAGEYVFYCTIPGHRGNGMEGTFIVA